RGNARPSHRDHGQAHSAPRGQAHLDGRVPDDGRSIRNGLCDHRGRHRPKRDRDDGSARDPSGRGGRARGLSARCGRHPPARGRRTSRRPRCRPGADRGALPRARGKRGAGRGDGPRSLTALGGPQRPVRRGRPHESRQDLSHAEPLPGVRLRVDSAVMATVARTIPADPAECAGLLVEAAGDRRTVRIIGSGTKSYLGDVGPTDVELSTERLAGVIDHVPADLTVTLGAGTRMADVAAALARVGQFLPLDPPHADAATIGGVIAANSNGFWRARYGGVRDLLIGTSTALTYGTIARAGGRVVKNVAGYDLDTLLVGSLGTLGVIVEATLKVLPLPEKSDGLVARFDRPADAFGTAHAVVRGPSRVDACVVERSAEGSWILAVQSRGGGPTVDRALRDARREVATRHGDATDLGDD